MARYRFIKMRAGIFFLNSVSTCFAGGKPVVVSLEGCAL